MPKRSVDGVERRTAVERSEASLPGGRRSSEDEGLFSGLLKKFVDKIADHYIELIVVALSGAASTLYLVFIRKMHWVAAQFGGIQVSALDAAIVVLITGAACAAIAAVVVGRRQRSIIDGLRLRVSQMERDSALEQTNEQKVRLAVEAAMNAAADGHEALSLVLIDVDDFRRLNNDYSYDVGSFVLRQVARLLASNIRGSRDLIMRYFERGDEFIVILPGTSLDNAYQGVAERLRKLMKETRFLLGDGTKSRGEFCELTVSAGLTAYRPADEWKEVRDRLVAALHAAKQHGKDRSVPIGPEGETG